MDQPFPAYRGDEPYVFVCYAHEDEGVVYPEIRWLHEQGVNLWYDEGISAGRIWREEIGEAIKGAYSVLCYISASSLASDHCSREINFALDQQKNVLPVYLEDVVLTTDLEVGLSRVQALHRDQDASYQQHLLSALGQPTEAVPPSPRPKPKFHWRSVQIGLAVTIVLGVGWWTQQREPPAPDPSAKVAETTSPLAIAVLPFVNMSNDPEQEYFSDGITEDILNELARNTSLTVRPRSSAFALKGAGVDLQVIGQRLNVTHVLEGSVRRSGERIRVTVQLSEVDGNRSIWSDRYERELTDIFVIQDEITQEVLAALNAQFVRRAAPRQFVDGEAYEAFLLGRHHMNRIEIVDAIRWLKVATDLNPDNAHAWGHLAQMNAIMTFGGLIPNSGEFRRERAEYIDRALAIDPTQANALGLKAMYSFVENRDYQASIDELAELVRANPNNPEVHLYLSFVLSAVGLDAAAIRVGLRTAALDPLSPNALQAPIQALLLAEAVEDARHLRDEYTLGNPAVEATLSFLAFEIAMTEGDVAAMRAALDYPSAIINPRYAALIPYLQGNQAAVQAILDPLAESTEYVPHWLKSRTELISGRFDSALTQWREGVRTGEPVAIVSMRGRYAWRTMFAEFYASPGYQQMLVDFGLDPASTAKINVPDLPF